MENLFYDGNVDNDNAFTSSGKSTAYKEGGKSSFFGTEHYPGSQPQAHPPLPYCKDAYLGIQTRESSDETPSYLEELSRINLNLVTQLGRIEQPHVVHIEPLLGQDCRESSPSSMTPLEDILSSTNLYLDILSLFSISKQPSKSSTYASKAPGSYTSSASNSSTTSVSQGDNSQFSDFSPASTPPRDSRTQPDIATLLLVLICYINLLRLHGTFFAHMQQHLQAVSESDKRTINPLPGLRGFSSIPLRMFLIYRLNLEIFTNVRTQSRAISRLLW
jgi:hypothetical protein